MSLVAAKGGEGEKDVWSGFEPGPPALGLRYLPKTMSHNIVE